MHSRMASRCQAGRLNPQRLKRECAATWPPGVKLGIEISTCHVNAQPRGIPASSWAFKISTDVNVNAQLRGIPVSSWSLKSELASSWALNQPRFQRECTAAWNPGVKLGV